MTSAIVEILGSFPVLESLILDARFCEYAVSSTTISKCPSKSTEEYTVSRSIEIRDVQLPSSPSHISTGNAFNQLTKLHVTGSLLLLEDLILRISSTRLEDVSFTVPSLSREELKKRLAEEKAKQPKKAEEIEKQKQEERENSLAQSVKNERQRLAQVGKKKKAAVGMEYQNAMERLTECRLENLEGESEEERRLRAINEQKREREEEERRMDNAYNDTSFITLLRMLSCRWSTSLKTVSLSLFSHFPEQSLHPPTIPKEAFENVLFHPTLENLTITGWTLDSVEDSIFGLTLSSLKTLSLPLDKRNSGISLSTLRHIAITCPKLESFQCRIEPLSLIPEYTVPTSKILSHGLRTLSVGNSAPLPDSKKLYLIARHLDLLFPHLETITPSEKHNAKQWAVVNELVKMCQMVRMDERYRQSLSCTPNANVTSTWLIPEDC